ncbi:MAG: alpha-xylosidase, partial [Alistipes sp.]|nr:alpha-xylosidase [Alistipes sp.]
LYALLYQKAAYEITKEVTGDGIVWARAAWAGCQRYPLHWGGDSASTWDGMAGSVKGGLHFGLSGFGFWSHDVPGFHSLPNFMNSPLNEKVYVRWSQFGVFTSHMRYHGSFKREPWHYPAIAPIVKRWWKLRYRLLPYIMQEAKTATETGYPMLRALLMHHADDRTVWHIDDEYYFGSEFLVAPVMNSEDRRDIYLPEGRWVNFFTGERHEGGRWLKGVEVPLELMPVYVREGAQIALYPDVEVDCTDQMDLSQAELLTINEHFNGFKF